MSKNAEIPDMEKPIKQAFNCCDYRLLTYDYIQSERLIMGSEG